MALLGSFTKQPAEVVDFDIDYSEYFSATDVIVSTGNPPTPFGATIFVTSTTETTPALAVDNSFVLDEGKTLKLWISGGTDGATYKVTARVTSSGGRVKEVEFKVKVKDF